MINDVFKRICVRAQAAVQNTSTSTSNANDILPKVKDWASTRYDRILRAYPWPEITRNYTLSVTASTRDYALRRNLDSIITIWDTTNGREIKEKSIQAHTRFTAPVLEVAGDQLTGQIKNYIQIGEKGCLRLMSVADKVQVLSSDTDDNGPVQVVGEVSGVEVTETITLNGTTAVDSANTFDASSEIRISGGLTSAGVVDEFEGVITCREKISTSTVAQMAPGERTIAYRWIRFTPIPAAVASLDIWFKKKWPRLINNLDVPLVACANEIIEGVIADALWEDGQEGAATAQETKFSNVTRELWFANKPKNLNMQAVPENEDTDLETDRIFFS